jgi:hypothetical protein
MQVFSVPPIANDSLLTALLEDSQQGLRLYIPLSLDRGEEIEVSTRIKY